MPLKPNTCRNTSAETPSVARKFSATVATSSSGISRERSRTVRISRMMARTTGTMRVRSRSAVRRVSYAGPCIRRRGRRRRGRRAGRPAAGRRCSWRASLSAAARRVASIRTRPSTTRGVAARAVRTRHRGRPRRHPRWPGRGDDLREPVGVRDDHGGVAGAAGEVLAESVRCAATEGRVVHEGLVEGDPLAASVGAKAAAASRAARATAQTRRGARSTSPATRRQTPCPVPPACVREGGQ